MEAIKNTETEKYTFYFRDNKEDYLCHEVKHARYHWVSEPGVYYNTIEEALGVLPGENAAQVGGDKEALLSLSKRITALAATVAEQAELIEMLFGAVKTTIPSENTAREIPTESSVDTHDVIKPANKEDVGIAEKNVTNQREALPPTEEKAKLQAK